MMTDAILYGGNITADVSSADYQMQITVRQYDMLGGDGGENGLLLPSIGIREGMEFIIFNDGANYTPIKIDAVDMIHTLGPGNAIMVKYKSGGWKVINRFDAYVPWKELLGLDLEKLANVDLPYAFWPFYPPTLAQLDELTNVDLPNYFN